MIWLKIKAYLSRFFAGRAKASPPRADVEQQLSDETKQEVAALVAALHMQHVSVRDVAPDEAIPEEPEVGDKPLYL